MSLCCKTMHNQLTVPAPPGLSFHSGCSHPVGIHHLREDWEGESTCPCKTTLRGPNEGSDGWWPGLINQQQHTAAVCISLPSTLSDQCFSSPQILLTLGCILETLFALAAAIVAEGALSLVIVVAEFHSAGGNTGWTHPTHHCVDPWGHRSRESHPKLLLPGGRHWLLTSLSVHCYPHCHSTWYAMAQLSLKTVSVTCFTVPSSSKPQPLHLQTPRLAQPIPLKLSHCLPLGRLPEYSALAFSELEI